MYKARYIYITISFRLSKEKRKQTLLHSSAQRWVIWIPSDYQWRQAIIALRVLVCWSCPVSFSVLTNRHGAGLFSGLVAFMSRGLTASAWYFTNRFRLDDACLVFGAAYWGPFYAHLSLHLLGCILRWRNLSVAWRIIYDFTYKDLSNVSNTSVMDLSWYFWLFVVPLISYMIRLLCWRPCPFDTTLFLTRFGTDRRVVVLAKVLSVTVPEPSFPSPFGESFGVLEIGIRCLKNAKENSLITGRLEGLSKRELRQMKYWVFLITNCCSRKMRFTRMTLLALMMHSYASEPTSMLHAMSEKRHSQLTMWGWRGFV